MFATNLLINFSKNYRKLYPFRNRFLKRNSMEVKNFSLYKPSYHIRNDDDPLCIFDRETKKIQRERASIAHDVNVYDYVKDEIGYRLADRIFDIKRKFKLAADIGIYIIYKLIDLYFNNFLLQDAVEDMLLNILYQNLLKN